MSHLQLTTYGDVSPSTFEMDFAQKLLDTQHLYDQMVTSPEHGDGGDGDNSSYYGETHRSSRQYCDAFFIPIWVR